MLYEVKNVMDEKQIDQQRIVVGGSVRQSKERSARLLCPVMGALLIFANGALVFGGTVNSTSVLGLILGIVLLGFGIFYKTIFTKMTLRRLKESGSDRITLSFEEKKFSQQDAAGRTGSWKYTDIIAMRECENTLYLFLHKDWALMVPAKGFTTGSYKEFRAFIQKKTGMTPEVIQLKK